MDVAAFRQRRSAVRVRASETPVPPDPDVLEDQRAWAHWLHRAVRGGLLSIAARQGSASASTLLVPRMGETAWQTAKGGWHKKLDPTVSVGDLLELEMAVEASGIRTKTLHAIKVTETEPLGPTGMQVQGCFIGSNDQEITESFEAGSVMTIWLAVIARGQNQCDYDGEHPQCLKWRRHTLNSFRAISYLTAESLRRFRPAPMGARALSLRSAFSHGTDTPSRKKEKKAGGEPAAKSEKPLAGLGKRERTTNLFGHLQELAEARKKKRKKKSKKEQSGSDMSDSEDDEDSESGRSELGASPVRSGPSKKTGVETHQEQPGLLGYRMVCESTENETTERGEFKPYVRADIKTRLKPIDTSKHKAAAREALTLARSIDHLVRAIIFAQEEGAQFDFSRRHPLVELWRSLDVQCQRLSALMIVLKAQAEDAKCDVAAMWASLEFFELEPPSSLPSGNNATLAASVSRAGRRAATMGRLMGFGNTKTKG